jgi:ubiquinone/menaquinone biosynthesis C-methylase UbiE
MNILVKKVFFHYTFFMTLERKSSSNKNLLQKKYHDTGFVAGFANRTFLRTILRLTEKLDFQEVLDVGCGEAIPLYAISQQRKADKIVGIDLDARRVRLAYQKMQTGNFLVSNAQSLPFRSQSFDLLLSLETLEHVGYPERALIEYSRVTRRYVLLSVPHEPWWRLGNLARLKYIRDFGNTPGHINHWSRQGFNRFVGAHFKILEVSNPFLWTFILAEKKTPD